MAKGRLLARRRALSQSNTRLAQSQSRHFPSKTSSAGPQNRAEPTGFWRRLAGLVPAYESRWLGSRPGRRIRVDAPWLENRTARALGTEEPRKFDLVEAKHGRHLFFKNPGGPYLESFRLVLASEEILLRDASWADWDRAGRLVFARAGKLFAGAVESGRVVERELIDLNPNVPSQVIAPEFAKKW